MDPTVSVATVTPYGCFHKKIMFIMQFKFNSNVRTQDDAAGRIQLVQMNISFFFV